jgi:drug/metabolite transporter (DMT)-like permease
MSAPLPTVALLFASVMWGFSWMPLRFINGLGVDGPPLTLLAFGAATLLTAPIMWRQWSHWKGYPLAVVAMFMFGGFANFAFTAALMYGEIIRVMMLFYLAPVWAVLGGALFLKERVDTKRLLGVGLAIFGAFLVLGGTRIFETPPSLIDVLAVSSGFAFAMNNLVCRAVQEVPVATKLGAMFVGTSVLSGAYLLFVAGGMPTISLEGWVWSVLYGLVWIVVATLATQWAVTHMEAGRAAIILIVELLAAVVSAALFAGEVMSLTEILGGSLILFATLMEARRPEIPEVSHAVDPPLPQDPRV